MDKNMQTRLRKISLSLLVAMGAGAVQAGEREELETLRQTTLNLIQVLVQQGVLTAEKADQLVKQAQDKAIETVAAQKLLST